MGNADSKDVAALCFLAPGLLGMDRRHGRIYFSWRNALVNAAAGIVNSTRGEQERGSNLNFQHSVAQLRFHLDGGRQGILFRLDGILARLVYPSGLSRVEFNVGLKLRRNVSLGVDGVQRHPFKWKFWGSWGWVLKNPRRLSFRKCKGFVGLFKRS